MKTCTKCKKEKELDQFSKNNSTKDKLQLKCKSCSRLEKHIWNKNNKEKIKDYNKSWNIINKDNVLKYRNNPYIKLLKIEYSKKYDSEKRERKLEYKRNRYKIDIKYRLGELIRANIYSSLKTNKSKRTKEILGCTIEEFKQYIESKFKKWMTWENQGLYNGELDYGWDLDHIIPISSAKTEEDIIRLNHYNNFQPLCSKVNRDIKFNKLNYKYE